MATKTAPPLMTIIGTMTEEQKQAWVRANQYKHNRAAYIVLNFFRYFLTL